MKKFSIVLLLVLFVANTFAQNQKNFVYVDELQEFSATTWILAGCEEYDRGIYKPYYSDIQKYFAKFKSHPIMAFLKKMRNIPGDIDVISYNSLPVATWLLNIENGHLQVNRNIDLDKYFAKNDPRWTKEKFIEYAELLDDFYTKSNYSSFFQKHSKLYGKYIEVAEKQLTPLISDSLFMSLYGETLPEVAICISPAYGFNNYSSLDCETQKELGFKTISYQPIIGVSCAPKDMVANNVIKTGTFIHELTHSFTAPIFQDNKEKFLEIGHRIYPYVKNEAYKAGYDADALCNEFFNTVMSIVYMQEAHLNRHLIAFEIASGGYKGYVWIDETMEFMKKFTDDRNQYPTIREFMPLFIEHMYSITDNIETIARRPYVVSVTPENGSVIDRNTKEIRVVFSEPMLDIISTKVLPERLSIWPDSERKVKKLGISPASISRFKDNTTLVLKICVPLESGKSYGIGLDNSRFYRKSNKYISMGDGVTEIYFTIK